VAAGFHRHAGDDDELDGRHRLWPVEIATNGLLAASGTGTRALAAVVTKLGTFTVASPVQFIGSSLLLANQAAAWWMCKVTLGFPATATAGSKSSTPARSARAPAQQCTVNAIAFRNSGTILGAERDS